MSGQTPFRTFDVGTKVYNAGTASVNQVPSGVFPGMGGMQVVAATGLNVTVNAGYCCVANSSSSLQGGYIFGLMTSQSFTVAAADTTNPRIDTVVAYVSDVGTSASFSAVEIITGTPATSPVAPTPPANALTLAQIAVAANVLSVAAGNITDTRTYVVAPGGILPIANAAAAPAVPASQFMYNIASGQLVQGTGTAGVVASVPVLKWVPQASFVSSSVTAASAGALTQIATVTVTTDGATDIEIFTKWPYLTGSAAQITLTVYIDGVAVDSTVAYPAYFQGGTATYYTSSGQGNTPTAATHTITWKFQASGSGTSTSDGVHAASAAPAILRVAPVIV